MNASTSVPGSLRRWERLLLSAELGSTGHAEAPTRDRIVDLLLFGFAAFAALATAVNARAEITPAGFAVNLLLAVPACLALWQRRRYPTGVAALTVGLAAISSAAVHACQVAIFSAAIHARPLRA